MTAPDFQALIARLSAAGVNYIIVGGVAAAMHGSPYSTFDLDVVYERSPDNLARIVEALRPLAPYLRGAPPGLPFTLDVATLERGLNFTLTTDAGALDLLAEIAGGGSYTTLLPESVTVPVAGRDIRFVSLRQLIWLKRAAGRPKDLERIAALEALLEEPH